MFIWTWMSGNQVVKHTCLCVCVCVCVQSLETPTGAAQWDSVPENMCSQQKPNKTNQWLSIALPDPIVPPYFQTVFPAFTFPAWLVEIVTS